MDNRAQFREMIAALALCVVPQLSFLMAGPNLSDTTASLGVRDESLSNSLQSEALEAYLTAVKGLEHMEGLMEAGNPKKISATMVIKTAHLPIRNLNRAAARLVARGEPAGADFRLRAQALRSRLAVVIEASKENPAIARQIAKRGLLKRAAAKNEKKLNTVIARSRKQDWEAAADGMHRIFHDLTSVSIWYSGGAAKNPYDRYFTVNQQIQPNVQKVQNDQARKEMSAVRDQTVPDFSGLLAAVNNAAAAVGSSGQVDLNGEYLSGPAWLNSFGAAMRQVQLDAVRCRGVDLARAAIRAPTAHGDLEGLADEEAQFHTDVAAAIAQFISADAVRASASEAGTLYGEYVAAVAQLAGPQTGAELAAVVQPALDQLVAKSPETQSDVAAYTAATSDLLRWRQRVAESYAAAQGETYGPLGTTFQTNAVSYEHQAGCLFSKKRLTDHARLFGAIPLPVAAVGNRLVGQQVRAAQLSAAVDGSGHLTSPQTHSAYVHIAPGTADWFLAVEQLRTTLLVDDTNPPLSIEAAVALQSAEAGTFEEVGGTLEEMELEGFSTKLTTLTAADSGLAAGLRRIPETVLNQAPSCLLVRLELRPQWLRHKYFYLDLN